MPARQHRHTRFMTTTEYHSYEPRLGHGLPHDPFNALVAPRPIGWISTRSADGVANLAPYSFFNAFNYTPPIVGFASLERKDTLRNIEANGEFVWNMVTQDLAEAMNQTCMPVAPEVDEFALAGVATRPAQRVAVPLVAASPVCMECRCTQIVPLQALNGSAIPTWLVLGEVVMVHIARHLLRDGVFDTAAAGPVVRGGGPADYFHIGPEQLFHMFRPRLPKAGAPVDAAPVATGAARPA